MTEKTQLKILSTEKRLVPNFFVKDFPFVSIIILAYNGSKYIKNLLDSLLDQTYPSDKMEIIVVDNASTDNTTSIVKRSFPGIKLVVMEENTGFARGNNRAFRYANHELVVFLNQDTVCHRNWLKPLVESLAEHPEAGACTSNMVMVYTNDSSELNRQFPPDFLAFYDLSCFGYGKYYNIFSEQEIVPTKIISGCSFIIRKKIVEELGYLFDEQLRMYVEDTDLSLRIHNLGYKTYAIRDSVIYHLHGMNNAVKLNSLKTASKAIMNRVYVFYKNMNLSEFLLFAPFLFAGGIFKILELSLNSSQKIMYFFPFAVFSVVCMLLSLFGLPKYYTKKKNVLRKRQSKGLPILKLVLHSVPVHYDKNCST